MAHRDVSFKRGSVSVARAGVRHEQAWYAVAVVVTEGGVVRRKGFERGVGLAVPARGVAERNDVGKSAAS